jgi:predicted DNA-binding protein
MGGGGENMSRRVDGKSNVSFQIPNQLKERITDYQNKTGQSLSELIRAAINHYIDTNGGRK